MDSCDSVSAVTHLSMAAWAAIAGLILWRLTRGHGYARWAIAGYAVSMVVLYLASGAFHGLVSIMLNESEMPRKEAIDSVWFFQTLDKSAIFLLILGSNVPVIVYLLSGNWRRICLAGMTAIAVCGITMLWLFPELQHEYLVGIYLAMGIASLIPARQYYLRLGWRGMRWIALFASVYVLGAVCEVLKWPTIVPGWVGPHEVLHVSDMLGTFIHFVFVLKFVIGPTIGELSDSDQLLDNSEFLKESASDEFLVDSSTMGMETRYDAAK